MSKEKPQDAWYQTNEEILERMARAERDFEKLQKVPSGREELANLRERLAQDMYRVARERGLSQHGLDAMVGTFEMGWDALHFRVVVPLQAKLAEAERRLALAVEALEYYASYMSGDNPEFTKSGWQKYPSPKKASEALHAIQPAPAQEVSE